MGCLQVLVIFRGGHGACASAVHRNSHCSPCTAKASQRSDRRNIRSFLTSSLSPLKSAFCPQIQCLSNEMESAKIDWGSGLGLKHIADACSHQVVKSGQDRWRGTSLEAFIASGLVKAIVVSCACSPVAREIPCQQAQQVASSA